MRTKVIYASGIDEAAKRILQELKKDDAANVIYFDGWDGLGASAVLRCVAERLNLVAKADEPVFHIDCSKWESRRAMQRMIAEQMKLPDLMMKIFDEQDEEDKFQGVPKGSRTEIPQIADAIHQHIQQYRKFMLILHNGSSEEINLNNLGFPPFDRYSRSKVLWSFQGRFRAWPRMKVDGALKNTSTTYVFISANSSDIVQDKFSDILHHEAKEVAEEMRNACGIDWPAEAIANCFLYMVKLFRLGSDLATDYDLATHICNYWRCDGITQLHQRDVCTDDDLDKLWPSYDAMQNEMQLDMNKFHNPNFPPPVERCFLKLMPYWTSPSYGVMLVPYSLGQITDCMFQQFNKLCVLKLSECMFSFTSPPFLCCNNLRFLWLDHCRDGSSGVEVVKEDDIGRFFGRLWVLDVRHSNKAFLSDTMMTFMTQLRELHVMGEDEWLDTNLLTGKMNNIRKLRVTKSEAMYGKNIFSGRDKLELLEFSGNYNFSRYFFVEISCTCSNLETIIINGRTNLDKISLVGCANKLKNIFLSGSFLYLKIIEITHAAIETLDLSTVEAPELDVLFLHACGNLCSILWMPGDEDKRQRYLNTLQIDTTTQKEDTQLETSSALSTMAARREFAWCISIRDARILRSLEPVKDYFDSNDAYVELSSPTTALCGDATESKHNGIMNNSEQLFKDNATIYADVTLKASGGMDNHALTPGIMQTCPPPRDVSSEGCYMHIEDSIKRNKSQATRITLPGFICDAAKVLHVHDCLHITKICDAPLASSTTWNRLEWCRIDGCPNLECVFDMQLVGEHGQKRARNMFRKLQTTWVSYLPDARYIWKLSDTSISLNTFLEGIKLLHLDYCPRLVYIFDVPADKYMTNLETLEIKWCGDLVSSSIYYYEEFPNLKHIYLQELPKLQHIGDQLCDWIHVPKLETIKIRGCWSLRKLPIVDNKRVVECDCEKEWWKNLQWESVEHAAQYKPTHPRHYKRTMIKGSVLR